MNSTIWDRTSCQLERVKLHQRQNWLIVEIINAGPKTKILTQFSFSQNLYWPLPGLCLQIWLEMRVCLLKLYVIKIKLLPFLVGDHSGNIRFLARLSGYKIKFSGFIITVKINFAITSKLENKTVWDECFQ